MRQVVTALIALTCLCAFAANHAEAQAPKSYAVGITNRTDMDVIVKGYTIVNGVQRAGPILQIAKAGSAFDISVPAGIRYYTVYDSNYKILLRDHQVLVPNRNVTIEILPVPGQPNRVIIR